MRDYIFLCIMGLELVCFKNKTNYYRGERHVYGWLIVNHFIKSEKFDQIYNWLEVTAERKGHKLVRKSNVQAMTTIGNEHISSRIDNETKPDYVIFWDKDVRLAKILETKGLRLFNCAKSIEMCDDKALTHICLANTEIRMPKTIVAPMTFQNIGYVNYSFLDMVIEELAFPIVIKECYGSFGQQVYLAKNYGSLLDIVRKIGTKPMLFQEFISSSKGRDIRINVVANKPIASMLRYSETDFRSNVSNGGKIMEYKPSNAQLDMAIKACEQLYLDFAGVDILFGKDEEPILCEINSSAQFKSTYDCTGVNIADFIIDHITEEMER